VIWEPTASRLVQEGLARRIASGESVQENDGGFLAMRADLIKQRPDVVKAWLQAELDAQLFLAGVHVMDRFVTMIQRDFTVPALARAGAAAVGATDRGDVTPRPDDVPALAVDEEPAADPAVTPSSTPCQSKTPA
jgi:ABC-type nitrate/sulfonate/bicarbonate transport system substrate-binding protein